MATKEEVSIPNFEIKVTNNKTLKTHSDIQMNILHEQMKQQFPDLKISRQYLSDIIRDNNITRKRATFKHFQKLIEGILETNKKN